jgi:hypothetical protein
MMLRKKSPDKSNFLNYRPLQSGQNQPPPTKDIPFRPKPTSSITSYSSQNKTNFVHFKLFPSSQNQLLPSQAKTNFLDYKPFQSCLKLTFSISSHSSIRGLGQSVCRRPDLVQCSRNWSVRSDFECTVKFCLYRRGKHSPWLLTPYMGLECKGW